MLELGCCLLSHRFRRWQGLWRWRHFGRKWTKEKIGTLTLSLMGFLSSASNQEPENENKLTEHRRLDQNSPVTSHRVYTSKPLQTYSRLLRESTLKEIFILFCLLWQNQRPFDISPLCSVHHCVCVRQRPITPDLAPPPLSARCCWSASVCVCLCSDRTVFFNLVLWWFSQSLITNCQ